MLQEIVAFFSMPEDYVCTWRNGELYLEPATVPAN